MTGKRRSPAVRKQISSSAVELACFGSRFVCSGRQTSSVGLRNGVKWGMSVRYGSARIGQCRRNPGTRGNNKKFGRSKRCRTSGFGMMLHQLLRNSAKRFPDRIAVVDQRRRAGNRERWSAGMRGMAPNHLLSAKRKLKRAFMTTRSKYLRWRKSFGAEEFAGLVEKLGVTRGEARRAGPKSPDGDTVKGWSRPRTR